MKYYYYNVLLLLHITNQVLQLDFYFRTNIAVVVVARRTKIKRGKTGKKRRASTMMTKKEKTKIIRVVVHYHQKIKSIKVLVRGNEITLFC